MKLNIVLVSIFLFLFIIDSGGPVGVRPFALFFALLASSKYLLEVIHSNVSNRSKMSYNKILFFLSFYLFILFCVISGVLNRIELATIIIWVAPISFIIVFYCFFNLFDKTILVISYITAGCIFGSCIFVIFLSALLLPVNLTNLLLLSLNTFPGWFYIKEVGLIDHYPNIYFQATLTLVPIALFAYFYGYKKSFLFILFVLALCLSRFGIFIIFSSIVIFFIADKVKIKKEMGDINFFSVLCLFIGPILISSFIIIFFTQYEAYNNNGSGLAIRLGHLVSVFKNIDAKQFFIGSGPGSFYFSLGFKSYVDNIEISQLEMFRKYGIIGYMLFHISFFFLLIFLIKNSGFKLTFIVFSFYLVSLSNPVLLTFNFSILASLALSIASKERGNNA